MSRFTPRPGGVRVELEAHEARLMRELLKEMRMLLDADIPRADPVIARLYPDAYDDADDAAKYREMVGDELHQGKLDALRTVEEAVGGSGSLDVDVSEEDASAWLRSLTDMRLAIGTRLEVTEEMLATEFEDDDPDAPALSVMHWLGWLQESMLAALTEEA